VGGYAPRALEDSVRPRRSMGASGRPLNFTVRGPLWLGLPSPPSPSLSSASSCRAAPGWRSALPEWRHSSRGSYFANRAEFARPPLIVTGTFWTRPTPGVTIVMTADTVAMVIVETCVGTVVWSSNNRWRGP